MSRRVVRDAHEFGRVAVMLGGESAEREISLLSGQAVHAALLRRGVDAQPLDPVNGLLRQLEQGGFDRVWIALHGRGGEDGRLQGLLELVGLPFTGSGVTGCAIAMDKLRSKYLLAGRGIATPPFVPLRGPQDFPLAIEQLGLPLMVKPAAEGSSLGLTRVGDATELPAAFERAAGFRCEVFAEQWVSGPEYTAAILHGEVLPLIRIDAANGFYDYKAKYFSDATRYVCPCGLAQAEEQACAELALTAFDAVGGAGWGRVDFMLAGDSDPQVLEINTVPGMTSHSLVPMAAAEAGIDFDELCWRILETSFREAG